MGDGSGAGTLGHTLSGAGSLGHKCRLSQSHTDRDAGTVDRRSHFSPQKSKIYSKMPAHKTKGIHAQLEISPALAKIIGTQKGEKLTRGEVVKKLYAYVKEKKLQDEEFKMSFKPDATMSPVFGEDEQRMCWMLKHLKGHLTNPTKK